MVGYRCTGGVLDKLKKTKVCTPGIMYGKTVDSSLKKEEKSTFNEGIDFCKKGQKSSTSSVTQSQLRMLNQPQSAQTQKQKAAHNSLG